MATTDPKFITIVSRYCIFFDNFLRHLRWKLLSRIASRHVSEQERAICEHGLVAINFVVLHSDHVYSWAREATDLNYFGKWPVFVAMAYAGDESVNKLVILPERIADEADLPTEMLREINERLCWLHFTFCI